MFTKPHLTAREVGEFSKVMQTQDVVEGLYNCLDHVILLVFKWGYVNTENVLLPL